MFSKLTNTLTTFQGYIKKIFAENLNVLVIIYLDDILIYIKDKKDGHIQAMYWVFDQLRKFFLYANLKKY